MRRIVEHVINELSSMYGAVEDMSTEEIEKELSQQVAELEEVLMALDDLKDDMELIKDKVDDILEWEI